MKHLLLTLVCLVGFSALGATQLEALRTGATSARAQLSSTRSSQLKTQAELNQLGAQIEALKAQAKGKLLPGSELDAALKKSQELSGALTSAAQSLSSQEAALESANLALLGELSNELTRLRAEFDRQSDRVARAAMISKLRALRTEREQVRAMLPAVKLPALEAVKPSDDPEDLLEQADLLKDNEDKVRKQLQAVEKRIKEAKEERDLDNRVRQFVGDESLFDEQDRRLRITTSRPSRTEDGAPQAPAAGIGNTKNTDVKFTAGQPASPEFNAAATPTSDNTPGGVQNPAPGNLGGTSRGAGLDPTDKASESGNFSNPSIPPPSSNTNRAVSGADARPVVGKAGLAGGEDDDDLEDLEIQRAKLKGLAEELKVRASQLQKKAAQLK